jgi:hypothetical protein
MTAAYRATVAALPPHLVASQPITAVGLSGARIAYATADCRVHLWDRAKKQVTHFAAGPACEKTSTGTAVAAVSVAGTRVVFLHYTGGNIREWSLWTATPSAPKPRRLAFATSEPDAAPPLVLGPGHDGVVPWAHGTTVTVVRSNGSRARRWTAPSPVTALTESAGGVSVATESGNVYGVDTSSTTTFPAAPTAIAATGGAFVVQYGRTLESRGARPRTFTLARTIRLVGATGGRAVVVGGGAVRTIDLTTGAGALVGRATLAAVDGTTVVTANGKQLVAARI